MREREVRRNLGTIEVRKVIEPVRGFDGHIDVEASVARVRKRMYWQWWLFGGRKAVERQTDWVRQGLRRAASHENS